MTTIGPPFQTVYIPKHKFAFVAIPKNANTSTRTALCQAVKPGFRGKPTDFIETDRGNGITLTTLAHAQIEAKIIATVVRNPLTRIASLFADKLAKGGDGARKYTRLLHLQYVPSWDRFIDHICNMSDESLDKHVLPQYQFLCIDDQYIPNVTIRFESIAQEWSWLIARAYEECCIHIPRLQHLRPSNSSTVSYTREQESKIRARFEKDFELLGYK